MESLKEKYAPYFKIGAAVNERSVDSHKELILRHFNSVTCENEMKYMPIRCRKSNGEADFSAADKIYNFAADNGISVRGHTFAWHGSAPDSFENMSAEELTEAITKHIGEMAARYGKIYCWDVVNEAIDDETGGLRNSIFRKKLGDDYLHTIYKIAGEKLPKTTKLFYNDYNEASEIKRGGIIRLIKEMKEHGTPVGGVGLQCHISVHEPTAENYKRALNDYAALGLPIQITEMDISVYAGKDEKQKDYDKETAKTLARVYGDYFKLFREYKDNIETVTFWGVADDRTWLDNFPAKRRKNYPLPFDSNHEPKEAFYAVMDF